MPTLTVFGSAEPVPGDPAYQLAFQLGQAAAQARWDICNGGYGGTMAASAAGARACGGFTIGVTCDALQRPGPNEWIVQEVNTPDLFARLRELVQRGDAYVVLPGGTGTLLELVTVWELANKQLLIDRPLFLLGPHWESVRDLLPDASHLVRTAGDLQGLCQQLGFCSSRGT